MPITYVNKGTWSIGTTSISPGIPTGLVSGDFMLLVVHTANEPSITPSGWAQVPSTPVITGTAGTAGGVWLIAYYRTWQLGDTSPNILVTGGTSSSGMIFAYRGVYLNSPFQSTPTNSVISTASTSLTWSSIDTTTSNSLIFLASARDQDLNTTTAVSSYVNANLTNITERWDQVIDTGTGGGIVVLDGYKATVGATGVTTATQTSSIATSLTIALRDTITGSIASTESSDVPNILFDDAELLTFKRWLESADSIKCTLVEVTAYTGSQEETLYLSTRNYVTKSYDIPNNTTYLPILESSVDFTEVLSTDGQTSLSYGDVSINNYNGSLDSWIDYVWAGRPIKVYMGDPTADRWSFRCIFAGIVEDISFSGANSINLSIRDKLQRLNMPVSDKLLGNYGSKFDNNQNKEQIRPLVFGEVHNITPLLVDDVLLQYMVHDGLIERIIEVRDNGVPIEYVPNLINGTFTLLYPAMGAVTCSVQGDKYYIDSSGTTQLGYVNNIPKIIQRIITGYGSPSEAITASEMDLVNFDLMATSHPQASGVYISDRSNILEVCQVLATSVGIQLTATRTGKLRLVKLSIPEAGDIIIDDNSIVLNSLQINNKLPVKSSIKLGYCKNWTIQTGILTGVLEEHKSLYTQEYLTKTITDSTVKSMYKHSGEPIQQDTLLLTNIDSQVDIEATRLLNLYKIPRYIYGVTCTSNLMYVSLGDMVNLYHYRFGLSGGKYGQIVSVSIDWDTGTTKLEVLV